MRACGPAGNGVPSASQQAPRHAERTNRAVMLIRFAALAAALAACTSNPAPLETVEIGQEELGPCHPSNYPCTPGTPWGEVMCDVVCGGQGFDGRGYCRPYTAAEDRWCDAHPGQLFRLDPSRWCDELGNPTWQTRCLPTFAP